LTKRILAMVVGVWAGISLISCGGSSGPKSPPSGLPNRVLASQGVSSSFTFGELVIIDGENDTIPRIAPIQAGVTPGLMAISPARNLVSTFDSTANVLYTMDTVTEKSIGRVQLPGLTTSFVVPTSSQVGYAAVPTAFLNGFSFLGAVEEMNLAGGIVTTIGVTNAQTVVSNTAGSQLLVFPPPQTTSGGSNVVTVITPANAFPPVDTSCYQTLPNPVCAVVSGFDRPVTAIVNGSVAYVLNCGPQCGGSQASVMTLDLSTLTITNTIPVDAATTGYLIGNTLYVAGTSPTNNACTNQTTAATTCGRLDTVDLTSNTVTSSIAITDGYHTSIDMSINGQLFIGSHDCTEVGNSNNPSGEIRGCLTILNTGTGALTFPPENGDVNGLQGFTTREVEYVAQNGNLYVYNTNNGIDELLINDFLMFGIVDVVGYVGDVKAIDFF
jgi:hypothetical protein